MNKAILDIFTTEEVNVLKEGIKEIILEQVRQDLETEGMYVITSDDIIAIIEEALIEIRNDIKNEVKVMIKDRSDGALKKILKNI